jgi:hypothetical protein
MASKTLQKRVAKVTAELVEAHPTEKIVVADSPELNMSGAMLRERASAPRLTVAARLAVTEIARRKINKAR